MSAVDHSGRESLAGLTLDALLGNNNNNNKRSSAPATAAAHMNKQTLLDIIRDEDPHRSLFGHKDKKSWKAFRERLRLRRAGAAWISSIQIPTSDLPPIQKTNFYGNAAPPPRSMMSRRNSVRFTTISSNSDPESIPQIMSRRSSNRYGSASGHTDGEEYFAVDTPAVGDDEIPARSFRPQMSRRNSLRTSTPGMHDDEEEEAAHHGNRRVEERVLSAREAIAAQEAAEAAAAAQEEEEEEEFNDVGDGGEGGMGMSLMDLLEETDRQMGFEGARYVVGDQDIDEQTYSYEDEDDDDDDGGTTEHTCCVCMVRHKGSALIPCGHTFCRLCSRELWVQRGNCPICNGFILEIIDIF
ncbi:unnamed protein product [Linum trigynum]|uniref:RING-type domain-containing protein n=1 Tax=Linum trigynum TaxID=586398 RepID=A0AAV2CZV8_9ROSI